LERFDAGSWQQLSSEMAEIEIGANPDQERRRRVKALLPERKDRIKLGPNIFVRAAELEDLGFKPADSLHVAAAEAQRADALLSCDDRMCRLGRRHRHKLRVRIANPVAWLGENQNA
jgi:hypothetical protein